MLDVPHDGGLDPSEQGGHPDNHFPRVISHNYGCVDRHNPALGPDGRGNADRVGCHEREHTRARMDREHAGFRGYPLGDAAPSLCLDCHPNGREEEGEGDDE